MNMKNYGYKICYSEQSDKRYVRHFLTYTRKQAIQMLNFYIRYPPVAHDDRHVLISSKWKIVPVSLKEVKAGIWREAPF